MEALTAKQQEILTLIRQAIETTGLPPTRAEIAEAMDYSSHNAAEEHLRMLERKGAIEIVKGSARGIRLKDGGGIPLIGRVAAGSPILAEEHIEAHYQVDPALFSPRADYLLKVRGLSMIDAGIFDGDLLAVHKTNQARDGQIVVARLDEEVTVKRLQHRGGFIELIAENPDFEPIIVNPGEVDFAIEGIAVGLIRGAISRLS